MDVASMIMLHFQQRRHSGGKKQTKGTQVPITNNLFGQQSPRGELMKIFCPGNIQSIVNGHLKDISRCLECVVAYCGVQSTLWIITTRKCWSHTLYLSDMNERHSGRKDCIIIRAANKRIVLAYSPTIGYELNSRSLSHLPFSLFFIIGRSCCWGLHANPQAEK